MDEQIKELCSKWINKCRTKTSPAKTNHPFNYDTIQIVNSLENLSISKITAQYDVSKRIYRAQKVTSLYSDESMHEKALVYIPVEELHAKSQKLVGIGKSFEESLSLVLLKWFKNDFFTWINSPKCTSCGSVESVHGVGTIQPTQEDLKYGANQVELHQCRNCSTFMKFPRYNDPLKLLETKCGRCGEWANAFTLICCAMGLEARYVLDLTDHVWTEIYIPKFNRWVHADSCEEAFDTPLMYESGWGKQLSFVIALSSLGFVDVTPRYSRKFEQVSLKRNIDESSFAKVLRRWTLECRKSLSESFKAELEIRDEQEERELISFTKECRDLQEKEMFGRQSGSLLWRKARGEHE